MTFALIVPFRASYKAVAFSTPCHGDRFSCEICYRKNLPGVMAKFLVFRWPMVLETVMRYSSGLRYALNWQRFIAMADGSDRVSKEIFKSCFCK